MKTDAPVLWPHITALFAVPWVRTFCVVWDVWCVVMAVIVVIVVIVVILMVSPKEGSC
jgi:hypothetical protein